MIKKILIILGCFPLIALKAQDMHFTQYLEHHALINPALTGSTEDTRATLGYRNQWKKAAGSAYKSYGASYETKVLKGSWKKKPLGAIPEKEQNVGRLGAGLSVYRDKIGEADMGQTQINLTTAAFVPITRWSFLSAGLQAGINWRRMDQSTLIFPDQYAPGGYKSSFASGENIPLTRYHYFDVSTGAMWAYGYEDKGFTYTRSTQARFGVAAYHLNRPNLRVIGNNAEKLYMRIVVHGDMTFNWKKSNVALNPNFLFQVQGPQKQLMAGMMVKYYLIHNNARYTHYVRNSSVSAGLSYRSGDAIAIQFLYETEERYAYGISYDLNISPLRKANHLRGGPEFMVRFTPKKSVLEPKAKGD